MPDPGLPSMEAFYGAGRLTTDAESGFLAVARVGDVAGHAAVGAHVGPPHARDLKDARGQQGVPERGEEQEVDEACKACILAKGWGGGGVLFGTHLDATPSVANARLPFGGMFSGTRQDGWWKGTPGALAGAGRPIDIRRAVDGNSGPKEVRSPLTQNQSQTTSAQIECRENWNGPKKLLLGIGLRNSLLQDAVLAPGLDAFQNRNGTD